MLVLEGKSVEDEAKTYTLDEAVKLAKDLVSDGVKATEAAKRAAAETGFKKNEIYRELT